MMPLTFGEWLILGLLALLSLYTVVRDWLREAEEKRRKQWRMYRGEL